MKKVQFYTLQYRYWHTSAFYVCYVLWEKIVFCMYILYIYRQENWYEVICYPKFP